MDVWTCFSHKCSPKSTPTRSNRYPVVYRRSYELLSSYLKGSQKLSKRAVFCRPYEYLNKRCNFFRWPSVGFFSLGENVSLSVFVCISVCVSLPTQTHKGGVHASYGCLGRFIGDMGSSRVSQKNSYKLMGIMDFPITFGRNGYGCVETLGVSWEASCTHYGSVLGSLVLTG